RARRCGAWTGRWTSTAASRTPWRGRGCSSIRSCTGDAHRRERRVQWRCRAQPRLVAAPEEIGEDAETHRQHVREQAVDEAGGHDLGMVTAGLAEPADETQLDDAEPSGGEGDGGEEAHEHA